jgi:hypothetical protein
VTDPPGAHVRHDTRISVTPPLISDPGRAA